MNVEAKEIKVKKTRKPRKKKVEEPLPVGFPSVGSYVRYYYEGWRYGRMDSVKGKVAKILRPGKRDLAVPIANIEIPEAPKEEQNAHPAPSDSLAQVRGT